jgi:Fur family zinc uptake transcriptional regulator
MPAFDPAFDNAHASFAGARHDHRSCVKTALGTAARLCAERGARLTPLRRRVLELVWRSHAPVGAYDLLPRLSGARGGTAKGAKGGKARAGAAAAPPTVYRALEFLLAQGLIHRIESLNAYVGCMNPEGHPENAHGGTDGGQFLICSDCGAAAEVHDPRVDRAVARRAEELGFAIRRKTIEVEGLCPPCQRRQGGQGSTMGRQGSATGRGRRAHAQ